MQMISVPPSPFILSALLYNFEDSVIGTTGWLLCKKTFNYAYRASLEYTLQLNVWSPFKFYTIIIRKEVKSLVFYSSTVI